MSETESHIFLTFLMFLIFLPLFIVLLFLTVSYENVHSLLRQIYRDRKIENFNDNAFLICIDM